MTGDTPQRKREAIRFATFDSTVALALALLVNAGILIVAAGVFHRAGQAPVTELSEAYRLLSPLLGVGIASARLRRCAARVGAERFGDRHARRPDRDGGLSAHPPVARRARAADPFARDRAGGDRDRLVRQPGAGALLIFSQVVLSLQLPFAIVPLLRFTTSRRHLGDLAFGLKTSVLLWSAAALVIGLNVWLLQRFVFG